MSAIVTVAATVAVMIGVSPGIAAAAPGPAFTCFTPTTFLSQGSPTQLLAGTQGAGTVQYTPVGPVAGLTYNALGFDPNNYYLYALGTADNTLYQIDRSGSLNPLGSVNGLPSGTSYVDGSFDPSGNYWVTGGNGSTVAYEIAVTSPPTVIKSVPLTSAWAPIDFSFDGGFMWGMAQTTIFRLDLNSGSVRTFAAPQGVATDSFGAAWTFSNGNLGFSGNFTGAIYQVMVTSPAASTPTFTLVSHYNGPVAGGNNDGAACVAQPVDLAITKTGPATVAASGAISWTIDVHNSGPGVSSGFAVNDHAPSQVTGVSSTTPGCTVAANDVQCNEGTLGVGGDFVIAVSAVAPATNGTCVSNTASVTGNEADLVANNDQSTVPTCTTPAINLTKAASITSFDAAGAPVTYTYTVTNNSTSIDLTSVTVTDPMPGLSAISCPGTSLGPNASEQCTANYTTTQADVDHGGVTNTAKASGNPPAGAAVTASATLTIPARQSPSIGLTKAANVASYGAAGTVVTYSYQVANTGNVTLSGSAVTDSFPGLSTVTCPSAPLPPAVTETCTATYTTTQADVDAGSITNTATASGSPPVGLAVVSSPASLTIPAVQAPAVGLHKSASATSFAASGTVLTYSYQVTNNGNVTLKSVHVTDPMAGLSAITCPLTTLAPTAPETCTATYTTTQADVANGSISNTGTASGTAPNGRVVTASASLRIPAVVHTALIAQASVVNIGPGGIGILPQFRAQLRNTATNTGIARQKVSFSVGGTFVCSAVTDDQGFASCGGPVPDVLSILSLGYLATFSGTSVYLPSTAHGPIIIVVGLPTL
ncbi:MAG: DUF11 domain-containing protein [Actinomycetota bacterium]|nr:DUF11 domain-containing protein [Actinomycetota bacterium]